MTFTSASDIKAHVSLLTRSADSRCERGEYYSCKRWIDPTTCTTSLWDPSLFYYFWFFRMICWWKKKIHHNLQNDQDNVSVSLCDYLTNCLCEDRKKCKPLSLFIQSNWFWPDLTASLDLVASRYLNKLIQSLNVAADFGLYAADVFLSQ